MNEQNKRDIMKLIEDSRDAIVCSIDENGFPNAKAMYRQIHEGLKSFWFSTNLSAIRTQQWLTRSKASIYFFDAEEIRGVMLTGNMQVCTDNETKLAFWKQGDEQYYPLGPADPDYCMLKFVAEKGNYYFYGLKEIFIIDDADKPA
jgi:pyridoxamine 5'-phosphate oxidase